RFHIFAGNRIRLRRRRGKIHFDPGALLPGSERTGSGMEACRLTRFEFALLPKYMSARQRGVAAQINLDGWREPPQIVSLLSFHEKSGLRQIHLPGNRLHPLSVARLREDTNCRGVAGERLVRESVNLYNS